MTQFPKPITIRLKGRKYTEFRQAVHNRANGLCEKCGKWVPMYVHGEFDEYRCGHVSHKKSHGAGGADTMDNAKWLCFNCHRSEHDAT